MAENPVFHKKTKHIDVRHPFAREDIKNGQIEIDCASTGNMEADIFTKALLSAKHYRCLKVLGVVDKTQYFW